MTVLTKERLRAGQYIAVVKRMTRFSALITGWHVLYAIRGTIVFMAVY